MHCSAVAIITPRNMAAQPGYCSRLVIPHVVYNGHCLSLRGPIPLETHMGEMSFSFIGCVRTHCQQSPRIVLWCSVKAS